MNFKNRLFFAVLLVVIFSQIHAMARYDDTDDDLQFGRNSEQRIQEPKLSLLYCGGCGSDAATKCAKCEGVYYCSKDCQTNCWPNHKGDCKKIALAHRGDLKQVENFYKAWFQAAGKAKTVEAVEQAFDWLMRLIVRVAQDGACAVKPKIDLDLFMQGSAQLVIMLDRLDKTNPAVIRRIEHLKQFPLNSKKALDWARDLTVANKLVNPDGIALFLNKPLTIINSDLWYKERLKVLDEMAELDF